MPRNFKPERDDDDRDARGHGHAGCTVAELTPVRVGRRGRHRLRRILHGRRRLTAAGLAVAAAAMAAAAPRGDRDTPRADPEPHPGAASTAAAPHSHGHPPEEPGTAEAVDAPVRIADAATVRLLRPGDRIDVIAGSGEAGPARVVAKGVRVDRVPKSGDTDSGDGALVVLRVPREAATALAGTAAGTRLAVTLC